MHTGIRVIYNNYEYHIYFFFQKLYKFINSVELISPQHTAKELVHTLRQGQIASLFQKSVRRVSLPFMHPQHAQVRYLYVYEKSMTESYIVQLFYCYRKSLSVENGKVNSSKLSKRSEGLFVLINCIVRRNIVIIITIYTVTEGNKLLLLLFCY